jgi:hypothetical protein
VAYRHGLRQGGLRRRQAKWNDDARLVILAAIIGFSGCAFAQTAACSIWNIAVDHFYITSLYHRSAAAVHR